MSRPSLGPTQPPIQWLGVKRQEREAEHSLPSSGKVKECMELYLHSPNTPSWHDAQLKKSQVQLYPTATTKQAEFHNLFGTKLLNRGHVIKHAPSHQCCHFVHKNIGPVICQTLYLPITKSCINVYHIVVP
jgi:hypothetical protein